MGDRMNRYFYGDLGDMPTGPNVPPGVDPAPSKLGVARDIVRHVLIKLLLPGDSAAVVTFSDTAKILVARTEIRSSSDDARRVCDAVQMLQTEGGTNIDAGFAQGIAALPSESPQSQRARRVFLLTDEQPNVFQGGGIIKSAKDAALRQTYATVIGVGLDFQADIAESCVPFPVPPSFQHTGASLSLRS